MVKISTFGLLALASFGSLAAATTTCSADKKCPKSAPCCNPYGECGTGAHCFGGCDARYSYSPGACVPMPVCKNATYNFEKDATDDIQIYTDYLGDDDKYPWTYTGYVYDKNSSLIVAMPKDSVGTVVSSTHYVWYGKVTVLFKSSHRAGVVSDFILLSDVKDEIDFEFVGTELTTAQTNYYYQGITDYTHSVNGTTANSTYDYYHEYSVDWTEDAITWYVDGESVRTLTKESTYNSTSNSYAYPQTPARIQLSIWPGGGSQEGEGTIAWAGGAIDWDASDLTDPGYYYAGIKSVEVVCYDPPSSANATGSKSYVYTDSSGAGDSVAITDDDFTLASEDDSYLDPSAGASSASASSTQSIADASQESTSTKTKAKTSATSTASLADVSDESTTGAESTASTTGGDDSGSATATATDATSTGSDSDSSSSGSGFEQFNSATASASSSSSSTASADSSSGASTAFGKVTAAFAVVISAPLLLLAL